MKMITEAAMTGTDDAVVSRILKALPGTRLEIGEKIGVRRTNLPYVAKCVNKLHLFKRVHISGWQARPLGGGAVPIFSAGPGVDVLKPAPRGRVRPPRRSETVVDALGEQAFIDAIARARENADRLAKTGDPLLNLFFGRAPSESRA